MAFQVVADSASWRERLPHVIEAFFMVPGGPWDQHELVRGAHRLFLKRYSLSAAQVPLLLLRPDNWVEPFVPSGS